MEHDFQGDIDAITALPAVRTILTVVCKITGMGFAAVARVTEDRWIACAVHDEIQFGLKPGGELKVDSTICHEIRQSGRGVIIDHVAESAVWRDHHTPLQYGFQSYISIPIVLRDGRLFGTLCPIDPKPADLDNPEIIGMFEQFADLIAYHLDAHERLITSQASLMDERKTAELREQFIAVLGHDLRNPLASIAGGTRLLLKDSPSEKSQTILKMMQASVGRMTGLIGDVLDFARGRLGGGFAVDVAEENLQSVLAQVAGELSGEHPDREIDMEIAVGQPIHCDRARLGQLFSNLLGNALAHGARDKPIRVRAQTGGEFFELSVSNAGEQIPPAAIPQLFKPFVRGIVTPSQQGLGLGLYIASEIARAHGGTLEAESTPEETRFTFRMPL